MRRIEEMSWWDRWYIPAIFSGVTLTFGRLLRNLFFHVLHALGLAKDVAASAVINYPDERRNYPARYRGRHRLTLNADGGMRCTSCFLCATACPAQCIYIEAQEHEDPQIEKFPKRYEIDTLLCIYCGYCVEACPVDAIRMDTGLHPDSYGADPRLYIEDKEVLMQRSRDLDDYGSDRLYQEHSQKMLEMERRPSVLLETPSTRSNLRVLGTE